MTPSRNDGLRPRTFLIMGRAARTAAVVALVAAAAPFARAEAAPSLARWRLWRITRVDAKARPVGFDVRVTPSAPKALALIVGVSGSGSGGRVVTSLFWEDGGGGRSLYREGDVTPLCPSPACSASDPRDPLVMSLGNGGAVRHEYLILTWGASAKTTFVPERPGWRVREVPAPAVRRVTASSAGATGVGTDNRAYEHYTGASAAGGARGSLAWMSAPCDGAGHGAVQLTAAPAVPDAPRALTCSADVQETAAMAPRAVRWTVSGEVTGAAYAAPLTRLLVADIAL